MSAIEIGTAAAAPEAVPAKRAGRAQLRLAGLVLPVVLAVIWEALVRTGLANGRLMPPPSVVGATLWELAASGELATHAAATLWRVLAGFGLGALAGTVLGALTGALPVARGLLDPT